MISLPAVADSFKNKDFLVLNNDQKKYFMRSAIDTLGFVAAYKDRKKGRCVWEWYFKDITNKNGLIEAYMKKYPEKAPSLVLIALTEKDCGQYVEKR